MIGLGTVLAALPHLLPVARNVGEVAKLVDSIVDSFKGAPADQATLKEAIADIEEENDEGRARYRAKLDAAIAAGE